MPFTANRVVTFLLMAVGFLILFLTFRGYIFSEWNYVSVSSSVHFHSYFVFVSIRISKFYVCEYLFSVVFLHCVKIKFFLLRFCFCFVSSIHIFFFFSIMLAVKFVGFFS